MLPRYKFVTKDQFLFLVISQPHPGQVLGHFSSRPTIPNPHLLATKECHIRYLFNTDSGAFLRIANWLLIFSCSTGAGRTGVFIALSIVLERLQLENLIDIHQTVKTLRMERAYLVQTVDQYRFCFQVAVDYLRNFEMVV